MRPEWELGYNQGYAAGFEDGYEKGQREGRFLGFGDGFVSALKESQGSCSVRRLSRTLILMNHAGLFRILLSGPAAQEAGRRFEALGFIVETF